MFSHVCHAFLVKVAHAVNVVQVKLRDALVSSLQFSRARDAELAWVDGQLHMNASESHMGLVLEEGELRDDEESHEKMETDRSEEPVDTVPVLEQLPLQEVKFNLFLSHYLCRIKHHLLMRIAAKDVFAATF